MDTSATGPTQGKNPIEALSKEELIIKYKGLIGIAKKAKQAKDELAEENKTLKDALSRCETQKEADKNALLTMKEMVEEFTRNKLELTTQLSELQKKNKSDEDTLSKLHIENESLKRQLDRLNEDNDSLLADIDRMEEQLKQVNLLGMEQKQHLSLLELEVNKLKEAECLKNSLQSEIEVVKMENKELKEKDNDTIKALSELKEKYNSLKEVNSEQRRKFNALKDRFVEVYRKLKKLKECKRVLLETQYEYSEAVSNWQKEIIEASKRLCYEMNALKKENLELLAKLENYDLNRSENNEVKLVEKFLQKLKELQKLVNKATEEQNQQNSLLISLQNENKILKENASKEKYSDSTDSVQNQEHLNDDHINTMQDSNDEIQLLKDQLVEYKDKLEQISTSKQNEIDHLSNMLANNVKRIEELELERENLLKELTSTKDESNRNNDLLQQNVEMLQKENKNLSNNMNKIEQLDAENKRLQEELSEMVEENRKLREDIQQTRDILKTMEQEKTDTLNQLKNAAVENTKHDESEELKAQLQNCLQTIEDLQSNYERKEREHTDLLCEMRELNEALKARGDVISRQQEAHMELVAEIKQTTAKLNQIERELEEKEKSIDEKDSQVHEISGEIEQARTKIIELEEMCTKNEDKIKTLTEELQSTRHNEDTQSEIMSTSTISRAEEISRLREVDESFEEKYNKLRGLAVKLKKKLQEQTAYVSEMEKQLTNTNTLKTELEEAQKNLEILKAQLEESKNLISSQKNEIQKLKSSRKQANVLNLEIEAAEKSLSEATTKLALKINEIETLTESVASKESTIVQLRKEIQLLESTKEAECSHSKELKKQIDLLQKQIKDVVHNKEQMLEANKEIEASRESLKLELEEVRLQLANIASKNETELSLTNAEKQKVEDQLLQLQDEHRIIQANLKTAERTMEDLRVEYLDYKVKAQAVLRKNQNKDSTKQREQEEELLMLRANEKQLQTNIETYKKRVEESEREIEIIKEDNNSMQRRNKELMDLVNELKQQNENMAMENRQQMQIHQESLKNHRLQIENLDACHKEQVRELEASHVRQIEELRSANLVRQSPIVGAAKTTTIQAPHTNLFPGTTDQSKIDFLLMEREDAEGSEEAEALANIAANRKISTTSRRSQHDFMPLDELLNSPMNLISDTVTTITSTSLGRTDDGKSNDDSVNLELQVTKELLQKQESRMRHLTGLLAENEQDLAKLTQMNDMLKEELRRQERGVEREKHMHNSEYLKNVIVKFLTLNNGDEKTRLVPVLNTILKLSRSESEMLTCVAKGQKVTTESNNRGWGNFLPSWGNNN